MHTIFNIFFVLVSFCAFEIYLLKLMRNYLILSHDRKHEEKGSDRLYIHNAAY